MQRIKIVVILGPTATGKSSLAVRMAKKYDGEILSADSRQVYTGMDIGSGKISPEEMGGIPHHLIDIVSPKTSYNVTKFQKSARVAIKNISNRGKLPILVGGTGFWIDAVIHGTEFPDVPPDAKLRAKLKTWSVQKLYNHLLKIDPERAASIVDPKNPVRLIRAIEIACGLQGQKPLLRARTNDIGFEALFIGLDLPDEQLRMNIGKRLHQRICAGMVAETARLHKNGISWKRLEEFGLEYRAMVNVLRDKLPIQAAEERLLTDIWHYAKRQRTWFRRNKNIHWITAKPKPIAYAEATSLVQTFVGKKKRPTRAQ